MPWRVHDKMYKLLNYHIYLNKHVVLSQQSYHGRSQHIYLEYNFFQHVQVIPDANGIEFVL
jgi:hypothetical protein